MCRPDHFDVEYEINAWMHLDRRVDRRLAREQWDTLYRTFTELGETVELVDQVPGLPDMVFTANAGVVWNRNVVVSHFRPAERQGEEPYFTTAFETLGLAVHTLPAGISFEGAGDALFVERTLFAGWGFRTDLESHQLVGEKLGVEVVSLRLVDPRFYHLDTCFSPLNEHTVMFAPDAFDDASARLIRRRVPHVIEVPVDVARGFACNALAVGRHLVSSLAAERLEGPLEDAGFDTMTVPMSEFMKSGGGVRCLSLPLDVGSA
jgi:N-dimethylarginine dimethylaminohydrolase